MGGASIRRYVSLRERTYGYAHSPLRGVCPPGTKTDEHWMDWNGERATHGTLRDGPFGVALRSCVFASLNCLHIGVICLYNKTRRTENFHDGSVFISGVLSL
jgi:hypothetical protein